MESAADRELWRGRRGAKQVVVGRGPAGSQRGGCPRGKGAGSGVGGSGIAEERGCSPCPRSPIRPRPAQQGGGGAGGERFVTSIQQIGSDLLCCPFSGCKELFSVMQPSSEFIIVLVKIPWLIPGQANLQQKSLLELLFSL